MSLALENTIQELRDLCPAVPEGASAAMGGAWVSVIGLIDAIKAKDVTSILKGVRDLLNLYLGTESNLVDVPSAALGAGLNWTALLAILGKILGAVGKA